jgi:hypothetical protein
MEQGNGYDYRVDNRIRLTKELIGRIFYALREDVEADLEEDMAGGAWLGTFPNPTDILRRIAAQINDLTCLDTTPNNPDRVSFTIAEHRSGESLKTVPEIVVFREAFWRLDEETVDNLRGSVEEETIGWSRKSIGHALDVFTDILVHLRSRAAEVGIDERLTTPLSKE